MTNFYHCFIGDLHYIVAICFKTFAAKNDIVSLFYKVMVSFTVMLGTVQSRGPEEH